MNEMTEILNFVLTTRYVLTNKKLFTTRPNPLFHKTFVKGGWVGVW